VSDRTSFTELSTLALCEAMHGYQYVTREPRAEQTNPAHLGSIMHKVCSTWWEKGKPAAAEAFYQLVIESLGDQKVTAGMVNAASEREPFATASWLLQRYDEHYGPSHDIMKVVGSELYAEAYIPGTSTLMRGYFDNIVSMDDELWLIERKTMTDWQKLDLVRVDPQITDYVWLLREVGVPIVGVGYDAIRTYRWKRDPHPPADSFQWLWIPRTDEQVAAGVREMQKTNLRRVQLKAGLDPIRNIGRHCLHRCDYRAKCWGALEINDESFTVAADD
jgi:hypothetical protein